MEIAFIIKGLLLGLSIAAPVGPMGVLCIRRTLANGMLNGFFTGLGTALADAVYGAIAGFGITAIASFLLDNSTFLRITGGLFLLYLGYNTYTSRPAVQEAQAHSKNLAGAFFSSFVLTLSNPMTIISFAAVFAGLGAGSTGGNYADAAALVAGVFTGSLLWWFILSSTVNMLKTKFNQARMRWVNIASGIVIAAFGVASLISTIKAWPL